MNFKKLSIIAISLIPAFVFAQDVDSEEVDAENPDKSYFADFEKEKPYLPFYHEDAKTKRRTDYVLLDIEQNGTTRNFVLGLSIDESQELIIKETDKDMTLVYEAPEDLTKTVQDLLIEEDLDGAIKELRKSTYALFKLIDTSEELFPVQDTILEYIELLLRSRRINEFYSIFEVLKYDTIKEEFADLTIDLAKLLAEENDFERCLKVLERLNIEVKKQDSIPALMDILTIFRDAKQIAEVNRFYQRLQAIKGNKLALEAKMWSLYCEIQLGNVLTAKVLLESFGTVDKKVPEYSLYKLILGLIQKDAKNTIPALENFSEGIVYGKSVDDWMPELMYNTALGYALKGENDVAMQIVAEMKKFYPENLYLAMAQNDIKAEK